MNALLTTSVSDINDDEENSMKLKLTSLAMAAALGMSAGAYAGLLSKDEIKQADDRISADFKAAKQTCDSRSGNAKDICLAEAKGQEKVAKAELEARDKGTPKAQQEALDARAVANYEVAKQHCDNFAGNPKDVCQKDAQAVFTKAKADAKLARTTQDTRASASEKIGDARQQAANTKREADYKAARERCDALAGNAKDTCVNEARSRFGMM
jgi:hypothetical protein